MSVNPAKRFGADTKDSWAVMDLGTEYTIDPDAFVSMGRATPFSGRKVFGRCVINVIRGEIGFTD